MTERVAVETIVIGGGVMGAAAAWALARRGRSVALWEARSEGHTLGASHGSTRNFNPSYSEPHYLRLLQRALPLWRELESESDDVLLEQTGIVNRGPRSDAAELARNAPAFGFRVETVPPEEASRRWPGLRFASDATFMPQGGRLYADRAVAAFLRSARRNGAQVTHDSPVLDVRPLDESRIEVRTADQTIEARRAIVTVGAWTNELLGDLVRMPRLRVTEEHPAHFAVVLDDPDLWPSFNHTPEPSSFAWPGHIYGLLAPGEGVKVGWHAVGPEVTPTTRTFAPEPQIVRALQAYVREWMPGADPNTFAPVSCTYTSTLSTDFILDRVGPLVVGAGFSGHGFKFAPAVGEHLADLATGEADARTPFSLGR